MEALPSMINAIRPLILRFQPAQHVLWKISPRHLLRQSYLILTVLFGAVISLGVFTYVCSALFLISSIAYSFIFLVIMVLGPSICIASLTVAIFIPAGSFCTGRRGFQLSLSHVRRGIDLTCLYTAVAVAGLCLPLIFGALAVWFTGCFLWEHVFCKSIKIYTSRQAPSLYRFWQLLPGEIRLVEILPGDFSDPITCNLVTGYLDSSQYEALSYVWGSVHKQRRISINGNRYYVGANLATALRHLRKTKEVRRIWVDAICINQNDFRERSEQVLQMDRTYSNATNVVIWLGMCKEQHHREGVRLITDLANKDQKDVDLIWQQSEICHPAVNALFMADWWDRIWVIQEVVLSRDAFVQFGHQTLPFSDVCSFATNPAVIGRLEGLKRVSVFNTASRIYSLRARRTDPEYGLLSYAHSFRHLKSTDERDKIYALMGLLVSVENAMIPVDYTKPSSEVFFDFAKSSMNKYQSLLPIAMAGTHSNGDSSWCPSWTFLADNWIPIPFAQSFYGLEWEHARPFWRGGLDDLRWNPLQVPEDYHAAGGHPAVCKTNLSNPRLISVSGFTLDTIVAVGDQAMFKVLSTWWDFLHLWEEIAFGYSLAPEKQKKEAFNRTLTANLFRRSIPDWREWAPRSGNMWTAQVLSVGEPEPPTIQDIMKAACGNRRFFVTSNGTFGLGSAGTRVGFKVCIILGSDVPFLLQSFEASKDKRTKCVQNEFPTVHRVRGQAYVDGAMVYKGEIRNDIKSGIIRLEEYVLL